MQRTTLLLFLLVLGILGSLGSLVSRQTLRTPQEILAEVQMALGEEGVDERSLLRRLDASLRKTEPKAAGHAGREEVCANMRLTRGRILLRIGATDGAKEDFQQVLERYRPGDREVRRLLIQAENAAGETEAAVAHLRELLSDEPNFGPAWVEMGLLHQQLAQQSLAQCKEKLSFFLVEKDAETAMGILQQLAARDPGDTRRTTMLYSLRQLFPPSSEEIFGQVLGLCDDASVQLSDCRKALVHSFSLELNAEALSHYLQILQDAGQVQETLELGGLIALPGPGHSSPEAAQLLIRILLDRDDPRHAAKIAAQWTLADAPLSAEFLQLACEALYAGREWSALSRASIRLRSIGDVEDETIYAFYTGLSQASSKGKRALRALPALTRFALARSREPFPGARKVAWATIAKLQKQQGNLVPEREALQAALKLSPDNGQLWLRSSEIQGNPKNPGYFPALPLDSWVKGMVHLPRQIETLLPTFISLGEARLTAEELDLEVIYAELVRQGAAKPRRDYGPYVLWSIARMHGEQGNYIAQATVATGLLASLPNFIPAFDELIDARDGLGDREVFVQLVLERISLAGMDEHSRELLDKIQLSEFSPTQLIEMMHADPEGIGRKVATSWYHNNGETKLAIETLESSPKGKRTDSERLLAAEILMSNEEFSGAIRWLDKISDDSPAYPHKLRLAASCALQLDRPDSIIQRTRTLLSQVDLTAPERIQLVDDFLREGQIPSATAILGTIDRTQVVDPGPMLLREIHIALLSGELETAAEAIERSAAFLTPDQYLIARMLLNGKRKDWERVLVDGLELTASEFAMSGMRLTWIGLCTGFEEELLSGSLASTDSMSTAVAVARSLALTLTGQKLETYGGFGRLETKEMGLMLLGNPAQTVDIDPRETAIMMLAAESPEFLALTIGMLKGLQRKERGMLWPTLLAGELSRRADRDADAMHFFNATVRIYPDCARAWEQMELTAAKRYHSVLHPQVERVRTRRLRSFARANPEGSAALLLGASESRRAGDLNAEVRAILRACELSPGWFPAESAKAQNAADLNNWAESLQLWRDLIEDSPAHERPLAFRGYLITVDRILQQQVPALQLALLKGGVAELNKRFPGNPSCILSLARLDLAINKDNPALSLERAWSRMDTLRRKFPDQSLEDLQRGATKAWAHFYLDTDPGSAEDFIQSELERQPGNLELWKLLGRVQRELGQYAASNLVLNKLSIIAPSESAQAELVATLVARGASTRLINKSLLELYRRSGGPTMQGRLYNAYALLADYTPESWASALAELETLWEERHQLEDRDERKQLSMLYGRALILRGEPGDNMNASEVLKIGQKEAQGNYEFEQFASMAGIAKSGSSADL